MRRRLAIAILLLSCGVGVGPAQAFECRDYPESLLMTGTQAISLVDGRELLVRGDAGYAADRSRRFLAVLDLSDLEQPQQVEAIEYATGPLALAVGEAGLLVTVPGVGLIRHDLSDPFHPLPVDTLDLGADPLDVDLVGELAFVATTGGGVKTVRLDLPGGMLVVSSYSLLSSSPLVAASDGWLYLPTAGHGLVVLQVGATGALTYANTVSYSLDAGRVHLAHGLLALSGQTPGGDTKVTVFDLAVPHAPAAVAVVNDIQGGIRIPAPTIASAERLLVADRATGLHEYRLTGGAVEPTGLRPGGVSHLVLEDDRCFLLGADEIQAGVPGPVDPQPPVEVGGAAPYPVLHDGYLYAAIGYHLSIVDARDPAAPVQTAIFQVNDGNVTYPALAVTESAAYFPRYYNVIDIVDVRDPAAPALAGEFTVYQPITALLAAGDLLYVLQEGSALEIFDLADPWQPQLRDRFYHDAGANRTLVLSGDRLFAPGATGGVDIFDVSDPDDVVLAGTIATGGPVAHLARAGERLLISDGSGPLQVWREFEGPDEWTQVGSGPVSAIQRLAVHGDLAYALGQNGDLSLLDLTASWSLPARTGVFWVPVSFSALLATEDWLTVSLNYDYRFWAPQCQPVTAAAPPVPAAAATLTAAPNPFNPSTRIRFTLPQAGHARLRIHDLRGRLVTTLVDGPLTAGPHQVDWRGRDAGGRPVASGVYLARLSAGGKVSRRPLTLLK